MPFSGKVGNLEAWIPDQVGDDADMDPGSSRVRQALCLPVIPTQVGIHDEFPGRLIEFGMTKRAQ